MEVCRSGVARPRKQCVSAVSDFWAETMCCGTFFSDGDRAITLPLCASPSELHLTFQPRHLWLCAEEPQRAKPSLRRDTWPRRSSSEPHLRAHGEGGRKRRGGKKKKKLCGQNIRATADFPLVLTVRQCATKTHCTVSLQQIGHRVLWQEGVHSCEGALRWSRDTVGAWDTWSTPLIPSSSHPSLAGPQQSHSRETSDLVEWSCKAY